MSADPTFRMTVQEIFSIRGRGTVISGQIENGTVTVGDEIFLLSQGSQKKTKVSGVEVKRKKVKQAQKGDQAGVLLKEIGEGEIQPGDVLAGSEVDYTWQK